MATSYTVLVVERTERVRQATTRMLTKQGCRVLEAAEASEALDLLTERQSEIDLVLIGAVGAVEQGTAHGQWPNPPPDR